METNDNALPATAEQARAALGDAEQVRTSVSHLSATPWPLWFTIILAGYLGALPPVYGGLMAGQTWLLPRTGWLAIAAGLVSTFLILFVVAANGWRRRTGVALRLDVLPRSATLGAIVGYPALALGGTAVLRITGSPLLLFVASAAGVALAVVYHLWFVRLHRKSP
jgi:hypothetical protein